MTSKDFVKSRYPKAKAERQVTNNKEVYWLVRRSFGAMYMAVGKSETNAWVNAKNSIKITDEELRLAKFLI